MIGVYTPECYSLTFMQLDIQPKITICREVSDIVELAFHFTQEVIEVNGLRCKAESGYTFKVGAFNEGSITMNRSAAQSCEKKTPAHPDCLMVLYVPI